jgi:hypothetical protein
MRKSILCVFAALTAFLFGSNLLCAISPEALQALHRKIGVDLMLIRKRHADMQPVVYGLLDKVGQLYTVTKNVLQKKTKYKLLLKNEHAQSVELNRAMSAAQEESSRLQKKVKRSVEELKKSSADVELLAQERERLAREKELFVQMKEEFEQQKLELVHERDALLRERNQVFHGNEEQGQKQEQRFEKRRSIIPRKIAQGEKNSSHLLRLNS